MRAQFLGRGLSVSKVTPELDDFLDPSFRSSVRNDPLIDISSSQDCKSDTTVWRYVVVELRLVDEPKVTCIQNSVAIQWKRRRA